MMYGTAENRVLEWRAMVAVCQKSMKKLPLDIFAPNSLVFFTRKLTDSARILLIMR